jgi:SAM-dependent methyltransferase
MPMVKSVLKFAHHLLEESIELGDLVIDATCGNGHDSLFLSDLVGENGRVLSFDIQEQAIQTTKQKLIQDERTNVTLIHDSHENLNEYLSIQKNVEVGGAIFNLGYLPRSDKKVITKGDSTLKAIQILLKYLRKDRLIVLVVYHGHEGGKEEKEMLLKYLLELDQKKYNVLRYGFINQKNNPPFILAIQKKQD